MYTGLIISVHPKITYILRYLHLHLENSPLYMDCKRPATSPLHARLTRSQVSATTAVRHVNDSRGVQLHFTHHALDATHFVESLAHVVERHGPRSPTTQLARPGTIYTPRGPHVLLLDGIPHNATYPTPGFVWDLGPMLSVGGDGSRVPHAVREGARGLRFAAHIKLAAQRLQDIWKLSRPHGKNISWAAVHVRRGDLYHCGNQCGTTIDQVVSKVRSAEQQLHHYQPRNKGTLAALVVSVTSHDRGEVITALRRKLPHVRLLTFDEATWETLRAHTIPGWDEYAGAVTLLRDAVEVQTWIHAPVFIGARSTMSEVNMLQRKPECTLYTSPLLVSSRGYPRGGAPDIALRPDAER